MLEQIAESRDASDVFPRALTKDGHLWESPISIVFPLAEITCKMPGRNFASASC
jgi:hypothetical protein